ncbi:MAG: NosD domain-containing protein [Promethearchaeota archaeon]
MKVKGKELVGSILGVIGSSLLIVAMFIVPIIVITNFSYIMDDNRNLGYKDDLTPDINDLKISDISGKIHINNNWTAAEGKGICTGNGTYHNPFVIEDLVIDGGGSGNCILIENSAVYFRIENCTLYNAGSQNAGIKLSYVTKGKLIINNCSFSARGIHLDICNNNTISGNTANNNSYGISLNNCNNNMVSGNIANNNSLGIHLKSSNNNIISGNTANNNSDGIYLYNCDNNIISGNTAYNNSDGIYLYNCDNNVISGNTVSNNLIGIILVICNVNTVLGNIANFNSLGIYLALCNNNIISGNTANNNSSDGISLDDCHNSIVSGNITNDNSLGISLSESNYNTISGNTANSNSFGIYLYYADNNIISGNSANNNLGGILFYYSNYNTVSGNTLLGNFECISEENSQGNTFSDNGDCTYGQEEPIEPVPLMALVNSLIFLISLLSIVTISILTIFLVPKQFWRNSRVILIKGKEPAGLAFGVIGSSLLIVATFIVPVTPSFSRLALVPFIGCGVLGLIGATLSFKVKGGLGGGLMIGAGSLGLMFVGVLALVERFFPPYDTDALYLITLIYPFLILIGGILVPRKRREKLLAPLRMKASSKEEVSPILGVIGSGLLIAAMFVEMIPFFLRMRPIYVLPFVLPLLIGVLGLIGAILSFTGKKTVGGGFMIGAGILGLISLSVTVIAEYMVPPYDLDSFLVITLIFPIFVLLGGLKWYQEKRNFSKRKI